MMVAAARVNATASGLVNDPFAEPLFRAAGGASDAGPADSGSDPTTDLFAVGTKFFDDFLGDAGRSGIRQVVILASGLDTRAYRLWWPGGTTVYELDKPRAIEFKTQTMRGLGATPTAHRRAVGVDLGHDWPAALRQAGFDAAEPTVWIAEGLLGTLTPQVQDRLLAGVTALSAPVSRFGADCEGRDVERYLQAHGWATVTAEADDLFAAGGYPAAGDGARVTAPIRYLHATRKRLNGRWRSSGGSAPRSRGTGRGTV
ncbi:class I SAM-dependent methyltransferase [Mycobacterium sp. pUA109]|uniref:class I SAM-dependent methyltransferase n=1 Tax=Mycobacterium sp. pUA109 TaxID=3238982 RepID=UPI00351BA4D6